MKTQWQKLCRVDRLHHVANRMQVMGTLESALAWQKLATQMLKMSDYAVHRTPKFNDLLMAIVRASVQSKRRARRSQLTIAINGDVIL
jgi:hypothetical protein